MALREFFITSALEPGSSHNGAFVFNWWAYLVQGWGKTSRICDVHVKPTNVDKGTQVEICTFHSIYLPNTYWVSNDLNIPISKGGADLSHMHNLAKSQSYWGLKFD